MKSRLLRRFEQRPLSLKQGRFIFIVSFLFIVVIFLFFIPLSRQFIFFSILSSTSSAFLFSPPPIHTAISGFQNSAKGTAQVKIPGQAGSSQETNTGKVLHCLDKASSGTCQYILHNSLVFICLCWPTFFLITIFFLFFFLFFFLPLLPFLSYFFLSFNFLPFSFSSIVKKFPPFSFQSSFVFFFPLLVSFFFLSLKNSFFFHVSLRSCSFFLLLLSSFFLSFKNT